MTTFRFSQYRGDSSQKTPFEKLLDLFLEILTHTSGDANEALNWMNALDQEYNLTDENYGMGDFIEDLKKEGYLEDDNSSSRRRYKPTAKAEQVIRSRSLEEIFGKMKKGGEGNHQTPYPGKSADTTIDRRPFEFGDSPDQIAMTESLRNAQINHGIDDFKLHEDDLEIMEQEHNTQMATVLMIDISHSMVLYGEDRITPAKKVAMGLSELISRKYPKDALNVIVFGNDAWEVKIKDLPYLEVGPYHTNTVAGLELAMDILQKKKMPNKQIFMITDGKPTCLKEGIKYYKNSFGADKKILNRTMGLARQCRKSGIPITTFMIARDPFLQNFVKDFTRENKGKAYYSSLDRLGEFIFEDFDRNRRKTTR